MSSNSKKVKKLSRREFLPLLQSIYLVPFIGFSSNELGNTNNDKDDYETLLKPDGTTVKVKKSILKKSKVVGKNVSNKSLLNWLKNPKL